MPPGVVTLTLPLAPVPTTARICVSESRVKLAAEVVPKFTDSAPVRFAPVIITIVPELPMVGENAVMRGAFRRLKPFCVTVPPTVVTEIDPPVVPSGTVARICVGETTMTFDARVLPKRTVAPVVKFDPVMTTTVPTPALAGLKLLIVGGAIGVNPPKLPVPPGVVTEIAPPIAPTGTIAVICVDENTVKPVVATPPKLTLLTPVKFAPPIVTTAPAGALVGEKLLTRGAGIRVNPANVPMPPGVVTTTLPLAPVPKTARISVGETTVKSAAGTPPKLTLRVLAKFVPVISTVAPAPAVLGVRLVTVGAGIKLKPIRDPVPVCDVTLTLPLAPAPTTAVICVGDTTVKRVASMFPKRTAVTSTKFAPLMVTVTSAPALVGVKLLTTGGGGT